MKVYCILAAALVLAPAQTAPPTSAQIEAGRKVYEKEKCSTCHSIERRGNSRFPLDGVGNRLTQAEIRKWITNTVEMERRLPRMPPVRMSETRYRLSRTELDALVLFLSSLK